MDTPANTLRDPGIGDQSRVLRQARGMRGNLLWYIPLFALVVWYFVFPNAGSAYDNFSLVLRHWTWVLLLSPSAYVFFATAVYSVFLPIQLMLFIPIFFSADGATYDRRYVFSFLVLVALIILVVLTQLLIHASFPLCWQSDGVERVRMVPILPCPK